MAHLSRSTRRRMLRCVQDSDDENTPPTVMPSPEHVDDNNTGRQASDSAGSTGTMTPPWLSPERGKSRSKAATNPPPAPRPRTPPLSPPTTVRRCASPTTSSPVLLEAPPPEPPAQRSRKMPRSQGRRQERREAAAPYARALPSTQRPSRAAVDPRGMIQTSAEVSPRPPPRPTRAQSLFVPAQWPCRVAHLHEQFNPLATVFPVVPHFVWCNCSSPCRIGSCRNSLMHLYCNINCSYGGRCGNGLVESTKVYLGRNVRTRALGVVAAEDIDAGEVLGQYLGEMEHVSISRASRPRNHGYRLVMKERPERPNASVCVAINAENMGGLMRFVNHSCQPVAQFVEVANGRRTTVVVATTRDVHRGEEVTADYGDDLWFVCRCGLDDCRHRNIQYE